VALGETEAALKKTLESDADTVKIRKYEMV
jgi:hypothetical protein